jgi:hypothetical protein
MASYSGGETVDLEKFSTAAALVSRCKDFFAEIENL